MKRLFIFIFNAAILQGTFAQTALVKDPDGFSNIRQSASRQSKILDTVANGKIVFVLDEGLKSDWLEVDYNKGGQMRSGYLHKSRVVFFRSLRRLRENKRNDSLLIIQLDSLRITMTGKTFSAKGRRIQYNTGQDEGNFVATIDGKTPWGTDGNLPRYEYKAIQIMSAGKTTALPAANFTDLFEPNFEMTAAHADKTTNKIYIEAMNGDGAGSYVVIWTIKNGGLIDREIFMPF